MRTRLFLPLVFAAACFGQTLSVTGLSPATGNGHDQSFSVFYGDTLGGTHIAYAFLNFSPTPDGPTVVNSCTIYLQGQQVFLVNDAATAFSASLLIGATGSLSNSQCSISAPDVQINGNSLVFSVRVVFPGLPALTTVNDWCYVQDLNGANSGWVKKGVWGIL